MPSRGLRDIHAKKTYSGRSRGIQGLDSTWQPFPDLRTWAGDVLPAYDRTVNPRGTLALAEASGANTALESTVRVETSVIPAILLNERHCQMTDRTPLVAVRWAPLGKWATDKKPTG